MITCIDLEKVLEIITHIKNIEIASLVFKGTDVAGGIIDHIPTCILNLHGSPPGGTGEMYIGNTGLPKQN